MPGPPVSRVSPGAKWSPSDWHFLQCFGERLPDEEVQDADIISAMEFDANGEHLATGDRGGRVVLFEKIPHRRRQQSEHRSARAPRPPFEFKYLAEFQSHAPEFDYLKSLEVDEKITKVAWFRSHPKLTRLLLSTNEKTIKLWKVYEKNVHHLANFNLRTSEQLIGTEVFPSSSPPKEVVAMGRAGLEKSVLRMPEIVRTEKVLTSQCLKVFGNAHAYNINSVSVNSDGETFLSSDDLRVCLWNVEVCNTSFNFIDMKPENMDDLSEVITTCECHPSHCNIFGYSSSKGLTRVVDMRISALCDGVARVFSSPDPMSSQCVFSEIIHSISDMKFGRDDNSFVVRDYMTVKWWDMRMEREPTSIQRIHEHLRPRLCDLYDNDCIFDKFTCSVSASGKEVLTGTYSNNFMVLGKERIQQVEASWTPMARMQNGLDPSTPVSVKSCGGGLDHGNHGSGQSATNGVKGEMSRSDLQGKISQLAWHPKENVLAIGACNSLFLYHSEDRS